MKFMLLIHQGATPTPGSDEWDALPEADKSAIYAAYERIKQAPGVSPGLAASHGGAIEFRPVVEW